MLSQLVVNQLMQRLLSSAISAVIIIVISFVVYMIIRKKFDTQRDKQKLKYRMIYISCIIFLLVMVRVWVEGFSHLFAMLSLIAAGLVVTNKESIMNVMGWFIISWRGVFSVGDYVQIQNMTGLVDSIKLLNFKLIETTELGKAQATGRMIKVPNGLIITNAVTLLPGDKVLSLQTYAIQLDKNEQLSDKVAQVDSTLKAKLASLYEGDTKYSLKNIGKHNGSLAKLIDLTPQVILKNIPEHSDKVMLEAQFYCYEKDACEIKQALLALEL